MKYLWRSTLFLIILIPEIIFAGEEQIVQVDSGAEIVSLSGTVEVSMADEEEWKAAAEDMFLEAGDKIKTGKDSCAEFAFDEDGKNIVRVNADTSADFVFKGNEKINLLNGELFSIINNLPKDTVFEIKTPTAVAGIRGTDWIVKADQETTDIEVADGNVYVKNFDASGKLSPEETVVPTGYATKINRYQKPEKPVMFSEDRRKKLQGLKNDVEKRAQDVIGKRKTIPELGNRRDRMKKASDRYRNLKGGKNRNQPGSTGGPAVNPATKPRTGKDNNPPNLTGSKGANHGRKQGSSKVNPPGSKGGTGSGKKPSGGRNRGTGGGRKGNKP